MEEIKVGLMKVIDNFLTCLEFRCGNMCRVFVDFSDNITECCLVNEFSAQFPGLLHLIVIKL